MKLRTHVITGFSLAVSTALYTGFDATGAFMLGVLGGVVNIVIDLPGHKYRRRTPWSHSFLGASLIALVVYTIIYILALMEPSSVDIVAGNELASYISVLAASWSHLLLDMVTEGGIFPWWPFRRSRLRLAMLNYDDPMANSIAILASVALLLHAVGVAGEDLWRELFVHWHSVRLAGGASHSSHFQS
ncbi:MAG TPA: metal-dependent hydrolase [Pyrodictium sp.]|nr:metal-dependent hydrolase [Pyrodictium sp.]